MNPRQPKPLPVSGADELWQFVLQIGQAGWDAIRYWNRRRHENIGIGVCYVLVVVPVLFLLWQHGSLVLGGLLATPGQRLAPAWPLTKPLPPTGLFGLGAAVVIVVAVDLAVRAQAKRKPTTLPIPPVHAAEWIVGRVVERTWNPDPGEWRLQKTAQLFALTAEHLRVHVLVVAPPGAGKTFNVLHPILRLCRRTGAACLVFDVKGDPGQAGDPPDFDPAEFDVTIDFTRPATSARLNLAASGDPRAIGEQLGEALIYDPGTDKTYFANVAKETLGGLWAAHVAAYGAHPTFRRLLAYLRDGAARDDLLRELGNAKLAAASDEVLDVQRVKHLGDSKDGDVLGNLDLALTPLARGEVAQMLVTDDSGVSIADLLRQQQRVRVILPVGRYPRVAPVLGRLILAQYTNAVLDPACERDRLKCILVDEAHWFVTPALASGMAQARGNFGAYVLAFQDLPQIRDPTLRDQLFAVAGNKLVLNGVGDYDAKKFSELWGSRDRQYINYSQTTSAGTSSSHSSGVAAAATRTNRGASRSQSAATGQSRQTRLRPDWLPAEIREMPQWHVLIERRDGTGGFTPPTLVAMDLDVQTTVRHRQDRPSPIPHPPAAASALPPGLAGRRPPLLPAGSPAGRALPPALRTAAATDAPASVVVAMLAPSDPTPAPVIGSPLVATVSAQLLLPVDEAEALITQARDQGWTSETIGALVTEVTTDVNILRPAAIFRRRIVANLPPGATQP